MRENPQWLQFDEGVARSLSQMSPDSLRGFFRGYLLGVFMPSELVPGEQALVLELIGGCLETWTMVGSATAPLLEVWFALCGIESWLRDEIGPVGARALARLELLGIDEDALSVQAKRTIVEAEVRAALVEIAETAVVSMPACIRWAARKLRSLSRQRPLYDYVACLGSVLMMPIRDALLNAPRGQGGVTSVKESGASVELRLTGVGWGGLAGLADLNDPALSGGGGGGGGAVGGGGGGASAASSSPSQAGSSGPVITFLELFATAVSDQFASLLACTRAEDRKEAAPVGVPPPWAATRELMDALCGGPDALEDVSKLESGEVGVGLHDPVVAIRVRDILTILPVLDRPLHTFAGGQVLSYGISEFPSFFDPATVHRICLVPLSTDGGVDAKPDGTSEDPAAHALYQFLKNMPFVVPVPSLPAGAPLPDVIRAVGAGIAVRRNNGTDDVRGSVLLALAEEAAAEVAALPRSAQEALVSTADIGLVRASSDVYDRQIGELLCFVQAIRTRTDRLARFANERAALVEAKAVLSRHGLAAMLFALPQTLPRRALRFPPACDPSPWGLRALADSDSPELPGLVCKVCMARARGVTTAVAGDILAAVRGDPQTYATAAKLGGAAISRVTLGASCRYDREFEEALGAYLPGKALEDILTSVCRLAVGGGVVPSGSRSQQQQGRGSRGPAGSGLAGALLQARNAVTVVIERSSATLARLVDLISVEKKWSALHEARDIIRGFVMHHPRLSSIGDAACHALLATAIATAHPNRLLSTINMCQAFHGTTFASIRSEYVAAVIILYRVSLGLFNPPVPRDDEPLPPMMDLATLLADSEGGAEVGGQGGGHPGPLLPPPPPPPAHPAGYLSTAQDFQIPPPPPPL